MSRGAKEITHPAGALTCTRSVTTEAKRGHATHPKGARKNNRTLTPARARDRVKIAHTCTRAFKATERSEVLTSRGAKRTVRYEKEKNAFKPHFVRSLARSAPLPGCGVPSGRK